MNKFLPMLALATLALFGSWTASGQTIPQNDQYLPIVAVAPPTATSTPTPLPTNTSTPHPTQESTSMPTPTGERTPDPFFFICDHDAYNCSDFDTQPEAQHVFAYCKIVAGFDVHKLDYDKDDIACEILPPWGQP